MGKKIKPIPLRSDLELYKTIRKTWKDFNPVTRVVENKKKKKPKYRHKIDEE